MFKNQQILIQKNFVFIVTEDTRTIKHLKHISKTNAIQEESFAS
jgi:hypothetical protein